MVLQGCVKVLRPVAFRPPHQLGGQEESGRYTVHGPQEEKIRSPRHHQQPGQPHRYDSKFTDCLSWKTILRFGHSVSCTETQ